MSTPSFPVPFEIGEHYIEMDLPLQRGVPIHTEEMLQTAALFFEDNPHLKESFWRGDKRSRKCWVHFSPPLSSEEHDALVERYGL